MKIEMPWSGWFNKQAKKRRKVEPWVLATISLEEEFEVEGSECLGLYEH